MIDTYKIRLWLVLLFFCAGMAPRIRAEAKNPVAEKTSWVGDIQFTGNTLNKSKALERKIKTRRQHGLDEKRLNDDVKALFETGYFDDVAVEVSDMEKKDAKGHRLSRVTFRVIERPIVKRIDTKGNRKIKASAFQEKVKSEEGQPFDRVKASLDERSILEYYREEGYANAQVEHYTSLDPKGKKLILTFFITEGERVMVKFLHVEGMKQFREKSILRKIKTRRKKVLKYGVLENDKGLIEDFYKNRGHLDVQVSTPTLSIDPEKHEASIVFHIDEGPLYHVGSIKLAGYTIFKEKELRKAVVLKRKATFQQNKLQESISNISALYADKGYLRTEVNAVPRRDMSRGTVDFDIDIAESSVVYVDGVYVDGNTYTKGYVIKREVLLKPGDVFSASRLRRSVEKIYNLGFLDDVQVDVQQPRSPDLADLIFTVKEGKPGILSAGVGFSSVDRFVGNVQVQHTNIFGRAQKMDVSYEFGARRQNFTIGWSDPWFLGYRMTGGVDLFNTLRRKDFPSQRNAYREKRTGTALRLGPRIADDLSLLFTYTLHTTEVYDVDGDVKEDLFPSFGIPEQEAAQTDRVRQLKSAVTSEVALDTRDNFFDASRGGRNTASYELSGGPWGGDFNFFKPEFTSAWYFPTFWKFVFSVSGRTSWVNKFAPSQDVPSSERFFLGGPDTIRGYDYNSITPRTVEFNKYGLPEIREIPGRIYTLFNAEYKFPLVQEGNRTIFQGAFFLDVGGCWLHTKDIRLTTGALDERMKAGWGFGLRFKTPVFPIRLDFAWPLTPRNTDLSRQGDSRAMQTYFTIGNIF
ncbi:MAG: outer membrane protein assembly factor BamA [Elusimicrobia bacterium]|nr:outer membrane protein assembly factor BamA [Candidatus Obscuribacterium magneticum]